MQKSRRHKPLNIVSPRPDNLARLDYEQPLRLLLGDVGSLGYPAGFQWSVRTDSPYLNIIHQKPYNAKKGVYLEVLVQQSKGVVSRWSQLSNFFLGNVKVYIVPNAQNASAVSECFSTIYVYLDCKNKEKQNIVTVTDLALSTDEIPLKVQIEPDQILEFVIQDHPGKTLQWRPYVFPFESESLMLELATSEYIPVREGSGSFKKDSPYYSERRIFTVGDGSCPNFGEWHFFFVYPKSIDSYLQLGDGCHPSSRLVVIGKSEPIVQDRRLNVYMRLKGTAETLQKCPTESSREEVPHSDLIKRQYDEKTKYLLNPLSTEKVVLNGDGDSFTVQIAPPATYFPQSGKFTEAMWEAKIESAHVSAKRLKHLNITPLPLRWTNGLRFQRWRVEINSSAELDPETIVGKLILTCEAIHSVVACPNREVNIIYKREGNVRSVDCDGSTYKVASEINSSGQTLAASVWLDGYTAGEDDQMKTKFPSWSNPRDHYLAKNNGYNGSIASPGIYSGYGKKKKKNNNNNSFVSDWNRYWQVDVVDAGSDLVANESIELMKLPERNQLVVRHYPLPAIGDSLPNYSDIVDANFEPADDIDDFKKKSRARLPEKPPAEKASDKNASNASDWMQNRNGEAAAKVEAEEDARKKNTFVVAAKTPQHIYWPKHRHTITVSRGQAFYLHTLLPKGNFKSENIRKQWTVNVINMMPKDGFNLWISSNKIIETETGWPHQEIAILPLTGREARDGTFRIGAIRLQCDDDIKIIEVDLKIDDSTPREELRWHGDYLRSLRSARLISAGLKFESNYSQVKNRTSLYNPIGRTIDVPVCDSHEIEILLDEPYREVKKDGWNVRCRVLGGGEITTLDHSVYKLLDEKPIERILFRVTRISKEFFGEITINFDGEDTKTRICPFASPKKPIDNSNSRQGQVRVVGGSDEKQKIEIKGWRNNQHVTIFPSEQVHISVPDCTEFLDVKYKNNTTHSSWSVSIHEVPLDQSVVMMLDNNLYDVIDPDNPYYGDHGLFHAGIEPWNGKEYILPALDSVQPFIQDILDLLCKFKRWEQKYPLASLVFKYEVDNHFEITQTLHLDVSPYRVLSKEDLSTANVLNNPADGSTYVISSKQVLVVRLPFKWESGAFGRNTHRLKWNCTRHALWVQVMEQVEDLGKQEEIFYFNVHISPEEDAVEGELRFECGTYLKIIKLKGIVELEVVKNGNK